MSETDKLPLNETGTHVLTVAPSGVPWECPLGYLETAKSHGYVVVDQDEFQAQVEGQSNDTPFDPDAENVDVVNRHLQDAFAAGDVTEIERVLAIEAAGKNRSTITDPTSTIA